MTYGIRDVDGRLAELCDECGFDGREAMDLRGRLTAGYAALADLARHADADVRPEAQTWSAVEYADHIVEVTVANIDGCRDTLGLPPVPVAVTLGQAAETAVSFVSALTVDQLGTVTDFWPFPATVDAVCQHLLHDLEHHVLDVRRGLAVIGLADGTEVVTTRR
ncbi:MAG: hypothetical protein R2737_07590 [Candidatus Nanopelagicales bacterium]